MNVAAFAIPLFRTGVRRSADERGWPNAQHKPLNAAKNLERPKNTEEYKIRYSGLAPLHIRCQMVPLLCFFVLFSTGSCCLFSFLLWWLVGWVYYHCLPYPWFCLDHHQFICRELALGSGFPSQFGNRFYVFLSLLSLVTGIWYHTVWTRPHNSQAPCEMSP